MDKGKNRLKGPGVFEAPGAAHMGGRLPFRLAEMCETYRDAEEMRLYSEWLNGGRQSFSAALTLKTFWASLNFALNLKFLRQHFLNLKKIICNMERIIYFLSFLEVYKGLNIGKNLSLSNIL